MNQKPNFFQMFTQFVKILINISYSKSKWLAIISFKHTCLLKKVMPVDKYNLLTIPRKIAQEYIVYIHKNII